MTIKQLIKQRVHDLVVEIIKLITSREFIQLTVAALMQYLSAIDVAGETTANLTSGALLVSFIKATIDKFSQAKLAAATNTTVSMPSSVSEVKTTTRKLKKADGRATVN